MIRQKKTEELKTKREVLMNNPGMSDHDETIEYSTSRISIQCSSKMITESKVDDVDKMLIKKKTRSVQIIERN